MADRSPILTMAQSIREATDLCMNNDASVYLLGEGVADPKAIFGSTTGLVEKYGTDRVIEMPVAENGLTGIAIGSALMGQRPLMVHMRVEFALLVPLSLVPHEAPGHALAPAPADVDPVVVPRVEGERLGVE